MLLRRLITALIMMLMTHAFPLVHAQDDDLSTEDQEIIENLEILEALDFLEEDLEVIQHIDEFGDDDEL